MYHDAHIKNLVLILSPKQFVTGMLKHEQHLHMVITKDKRVELAHL